MGSITSMECKRDTDHDLLCVESESGVVTVMERGKNNENNAETVFSADVTETEYPAAEKLAVTADAATEELAVTAETEYAAAEVSAEAKKEDLDDVPEENAPKEDKNVVGSDETRMTLTAFRDAFREKIHGVEDESKFLGPLVMTLEEGQQKVMDVEEGQQKVTEESSAADADTHLICRICDKVVGNDERQFYHTFCGYVFHWNCITVNLRGASKDLCPTCGERTMGIRESETVDETRGVVFFCGYCRRCTGTSVMRVSPFERSIVSGIAIYGQCDVCKKEKIYYTRD